MTEALDQLSIAEKEIFRKAWHALDADDEKVTIEAELKYGSLRSVAKKNQISKNSYDVLQSRIEEAKKEVNFEVTDPNYKGPHLPKELTLEAVEHLIDAFRRGETLHTTYAQRIFIEMKRYLKNNEKALNEIEVPENGSITLLGDTHGQLTDLLTILRMVGFPSPSNYLLFNGDFVDRGPQDVDVILILYALKLLFPKYIYFNRGNHEQKHMNQKYTFEKNIRSKYSPTVFELVEESFTYLPLCTLINKKIFVVHGGLSSDTDLTLDQLRKLNRKNVPKASKIVTNEDKIISDMLWSDPTRSKIPKDGTKLSTVTTKLTHTELYMKSSRGAGIVWGSALTKQFLKNNDLDLIVRSHEMIEEGYEEIHDGNVVTLFSASNYCSKNTNKGAMMKVKHPYSRKNIEFRTYYADLLISDSVDIHAECRMDTLQKLREKRHELLMAFSKVDTEQEGTVTVDQWVEVMDKIFNIPIEWHTLLPYLAEEEDSTVQYNRFIQRYHVAVDSHFWESWEKVVIEKICVHMNSKWDNLQDAFNAIDANKDSKLSYEEFYGILKKFDVGLSKEQIFDLMQQVDTDSNGYIDLEEFQNAFQTEFSSALGNAEQREWLTKEVKHISDLIVEKKDNYRAMFTALDKDHSGTLSPKELFRGLKSAFSVEYNDKEQEILLGHVDSNHSGRISKKEFKRAFHPKRNDQKLMGVLLRSVCEAVQSSKTQLRALFYKMDIDNSGTIDLDEFKAGLDALNILLSNPITDYQIEQLYNIIDKNKDGRITYEEFLESFAVVDTNAKKPK